MNIIETHNIRKNFGTKIALDGVSIHIPQNEICGFLGPNGAGKTTLMRILTIYYNPTMALFCSITGYFVIKT